MKFSHLKTSIKILFACFILSSNISIALAYSFGYWGGAVPPSDSSSAPKANTTQTQSKTHTQPPKKTTEKSFFAARQSEGDFWPRLRRTFSLDHYTYSHAVQDQINWFKNHPKWLNKTLNRAAPYMYYVYSQVKKRDLPGELVLLPVIESAYDPRAYSDRGAAGLWQLMPGTASGYGLREDWWYDGRRDIYASTNAALDYLTYLEKFFNGNWLYAIAAYDAGQGTIQNAINYNAAHDRNTDFWYLPLTHETNAYVPELLALAAVIANPHEFGINLPPLPNGPYFAAVNVGSQIDLATAAKMADISLSEIYKLNPGYNRWATDPNGPSLLLLPVDKIDIFKQNLASHPIPQMVAWNRYHVRSGDSLASIAKQYGTRIALLEKINKLKSNHLRAGEVLLIPKHSHDISESDNSRVAKAVNKTHQEGKQQDKQQIIVGVNVGDSLWSLAVKYQVQPEQIVKWNQLASDAPLHVGQKLVILVPAHTSPSNKKVSKSKSSAVVKKAPVSTTHYKVVSGDTLDKIAKKFGTTAEAIAKLNHLGKNLLHVGEELKIPSANKVTKTETHAATKVKTKPTHKSKGKKQPQRHLKTKRLKKKVAEPAKAKTNSSVIRYTIKPGDTLSSIAHKNNVKLASLKKWNKAYLGKVLHNGQKLVIYK